MFDLWPFVSINLEPVHVAISIISDILSHEATFWIIAIGGGVFVMYKRYGLFAKWINPLKEKLNFNMGGFGFDNTIEVEDGVKFDQKTATLYVDADKVDVITPEPEHCVNCGFKTKSTICPKCKCERDVVNKKFRRNQQKKYAKRQRHEEEFDVPEQPEELESEIPEYNQPGCDCGCHDPESGCLFCYKCEKDPKCTRK